MKLTKYECMYRNCKCHGYNFLSAATLVAVDYGFTCPSRFKSCLFVCLFVVVGTDENCNFSAMRSPIELKLGGHLGLVSQISTFALVSRFNCFSYCKQTKEQKIAKIAILENLRFLRRSKSD
jgi:hypothetical protein